MPINYLCSNARTTDEQTNVLEATLLELIVTDPATNNIVCDTTNFVKNSIVNAQAIDLSGCPLLTANQYQIQVRDPSKPATDLFYDYHDITAGIATPLSYATISRTSSTSTWVYQDSSTASYKGSQPLYILYASAYYNAACSSSGNANASPLVIDVGSDQLGDQDLILSSPSQGVLFDILGANATPAPYTKRQISWIEQPLQYMFLALPSQDGTVNGINELFGNNTLGPDGKFAANGFAALAKYDSNGDGMIDSRDAIFSQLRLWSDINRDGIAQPEELHTLAEMHIEKINLRYMRSFRERDQYGNLFKYASSVEKDGQERLIFDVWFKL